MQEPISNQPSRKVGERLDSLLSTHDDTFNEAMQHMLWRHTPPGSFAPDDYVIRYMERLHDVYFFCLANRTKPFSCLERILDQAEDDDETIIALLDSLLYLFSSQWEDFPLFAIQLTDFRNQIAPYMEDKDIQAMMRWDEMWKFWPHPPMLRIYSDYKPEKVQAGRKTGAGGHIDETSFIDALINIDDRVGFIEKLKVIYTNAKPKQYAYMVLALSDLGYLSYSDVTKLHNQLQVTFASVGTRQSLTGNLNSLNELNTATSAELQRHKKKIAALI